MNGSSLTLKKSLPFSLPSFIPLPVLTLAAAIFTSRTPDSTFGDVYVNVASHLSKTPSMATDAFTPNLIELSSWTILITGIPSGVCARLTEENARSAKQQTRFNRICHLLFVHPPIFRKSSIQPFVMKVIRLSALPLVPYRGPLAGRSHSGFDPGS